MRIDKIRIENFRCFKEIEMLFGSKSTIFIGKNGTGKSSIISALKRGLSFMFAKNKGFKNNLYTSSGSNIRAFGFWDSRFNEIDRVFNYPISIELEGSFFSISSISWKLFKDKSKGKFHSTLFKEAQNTILEHYNNDVEHAELPLIAYYSDSYPHILSNVGSVAKQIVSKDVIPRDFGYYGWDDMTNCMELWRIRYKKISKYIRDYQIELERIENQIKQFSESNVKSNNDNINLLKKRLETVKNEKRITLFRDEINFIDNKILKLTEPLRKELGFINKDFQIVRLLSNQPTEEAIDSIEFIFADGSSIFFEMLPQGYKRIFSIALDLAYRNYILNGTDEFDGVVFIDEIELHLHPTLQQEILQRLINTFPKIQFIVTTHSPLIVSNLKADDNQNKIIKLENTDLNYSHEPIENIYGIDYTTGLMDIMDAHYRPSTIDNLIDSYVIFKLRNKEEEALKIWDEIFAIVGEGNKRIENEINDKLEANA